MNQILPELENPNRKTAESFRCLDVQGYHFISYGGAGAGSTETHHSSANKAEIIELTR